MSVAVYSETLKIPAGATGAAGVAGALALLVHLVFFAVLYSSFSWQMQQPQGMQVDIWESLPSEPEVTSPVRPPPERIPEQQKVVAAPRLAAPRKADIELKIKKKKPNEEVLKVESKAARKLAGKQAEQAERRMEETERQAQARAQAQRNAQAEAAAASGKVVAEYRDKISAKIRQKIVLPLGVDKNIKAEFNVTLLPGGEVLNASLLKSSGNEAYDNAVERAILKAQPLPLPPAEQNLFGKFRDLHLKFSPAEIGH